MRCNVVQLTYIFTFNLEKHYINQLHMADKIYATQVTEYLKKCCPSIINFFLTLFCILNLKKHIQQNIPHELFKERIK